MNPTISIQKFPEKSQMIIKHSYHAELETIWNAHTKSDILEKWWAPEPYKAVVVKNNFSNGGILHYYMLSPEGEKHYCIAEFSDIKNLKSYTVLDAFCDENAVINMEFPRQKWFNTFEENNGITTVTNTIQFESKEDMDKINEMGFEEGYTMGLNQLFALINNPAS
jgi:uncharacterized protein YndB with AHSA1/START domain